MQIRDIILRIDNYEDLYLFFDSMLEYQKINHIKNHCVLLSAIWNDIYNNFLEVETKNRDKIELVSGILWIMDTETDTMILVSHVWNIYNDGTVVELSVDYKGIKGEKHYYLMKDFLKVLKDDSRWRESYFSNDSIKEIIRTNNVYKENIKAFYDYKFGTDVKVNGVSYYKMCKDITDIYNHHKKPLP